MKRIRVLIVEDSPVVSEHLRRIIGADPRFEVAGVAGSGEEALAVLENSAPDVISMDIHLPGIQGFEATRRIMARRPTPIVMVSGLQVHEMTLTMKALQAGALSVVEKPVGTTHKDYQSVANKLCTQLAIMSEVKVVRQRETSRPAGERGEPSVDPGNPYRVLGIAASTGGPNALMQLLTALGGDFALPIVVVQHMTAAFLEGFAEWLANVTPLPVQIVKDRIELQGGRVYLAPCDTRHMVVEGTFAIPQERPPVGVHRPSANVLFSSMARSVGMAAIGALLTGMGDDGAEGIQELRRAGAYTIAEDESTAVVYGMPGAAVRMGAIRESLPLGAIAPRILELVRPKGANAA